MYHKMFLICLVILNTAGDATDSLMLTYISELLYHYVGDGTSSSNSLEAYKYIIIGSCVGTFLLILLVCTIIVYVRSK